MILTIRVSWVSYYFLFIAPFVFGLLYLLSSYKSDLLDDESNGDGSNSGFSGMYSFPCFYLCLKKVVGHISVLGSAFLYQHELGPNVIVCAWRVCTNTSWFQMRLTHQNDLVLNYLILFPNMEPSFKVIVIVWLCITHSYWCSLTKKMNGRAPICTIRRPSDAGGLDTEATALIKCINGR